MLYRLVRPVLYRVPAELAHELSFGALRVSTRVPGGGRVLGRMFTEAERELPVTLWGHRFPNPVGLAAGFDKNAEGVEALAQLGFGAIEVGTITAEPQPGNPRPRLFRLPKDEALINRMGFNNHGAAAARDKLRRLSSNRTFRVGVNIGKTKVVPESGAVDDYRKSARMLAPFADYFVVNVSSPNTPGLRDLQAVEKLRPLLGAVREELDRAGRPELPLLVKIAPDLADEDIEEVAALAVEIGLQGIIATNTTIGRDGLRTRSTAVREMGAGGLSGRPLQGRAVEVLRLIRRAVGERLVLISVGGLSDPEDAWQRIRAGASLLQVYTGFVYEGPSLPRVLCEGLASRARRDGFLRVQDAVGVDA
ncbi:MAG: quinone-dependent dihydroorotate dehydrogenase [Myxococcota bacterium]